MAVEIERKFLVAAETWRSEAAEPRSLRQGYLSTTNNASVRVRIIDDNDARLTIKSSDTGMIRTEFEYTIPIEDASALMALGEGEPIEKVRYSIAVGKLVWEVDVFEGANAGLVLAEIELDDADQEVELPPWIGPEVTEDPRYYNSNLTFAPYSTWTPDT